MKNIIMLILFLSAVGSANAQDNSDHSEFFLAIRDKDSYTIQLNDQIVTNNNGRFRFFEVPAGPVLLSISKNNSEVFKGSVSTIGGTRAIASYSLKAGLKLDDNLTIYRDGQYALDDWNKSRTVVPVNVPPATPETGWEHGRHHNDRVMSQEQLLNLIAAIKNAPFADSKKLVFREELEHNTITVAQLAELLKIFPFDDDRLAYAFMAFRYTADAHHFYLLRDSFVFLSSRDKLDKFLAEND